MVHSSDPRRSLLGIAVTPTSVDHYRLLGLARLELNPDVIDHAAERQIDHLQRHRKDADGKDVSELIEAIANTRDCLLDHDAHLAYAGQLQGYQSGSDDLDLQAAWRTFSEEFDDSWRSARLAEPDPQHLWLGIPRHQRPASNERLLGLDEGERDAEVIRLAAERQIAFVRKFASGEKAEKANVLLGQLSRARSMLLRSVPDQPSATQAEPLDPTLLPEDFVGEWELPIDELPINELPYADEQPLAQQQAITSPAAPPAAMVAKTPSRKPSTGVVVCVVAGMVGVLIGVWGAYRALGPAGQNTTQVVDPSTGPDRSSIDSLRERMRENRQTPYSPPPRSTTEPERSEVEEFIRRSRQMPPMELDPDEIDRYADLAKTASEKAGIEELRRRHAPWEGHLQRIDDVRFQANLRGVQNSIAHIEGRLQRGVAGEADLNKVLTNLQDLEQMPTRYPHYSDSLNEQYNEVSESAETLAATLRQLVASSDAIAGSPSADAGSDDSENPFVVDAQQPNVATPPNGATPTDPDMEGTEANPPITFEDERLVSRKWTTSEGVAFEAVVEDVDPERVMFRRVSDDRKASMAIDQLAAADQLILRSIYFDRRDARQYDSVVRLVSTLGDDPESAIEDLKTSHLEHAESPYAGLWSSVCLSEGRNRSEEATRLLLQVVRRIEDQHQRAGEARHGMTLAAACNNLAVCKIKVGEYDAAALQLAKALDVAPEPLPVAIHNSQQLLRRTPTGRPLKSSAKTKLEKALDNLDVLPTGLPTGWLYSLDADVPGTTAHGRSGYRFVRQAVPGEPFVRNRWCVHCGGDGRTPCDYSNCLRGMIVVKQRVQVAVNQVTGEAIYGDKNFKQTCPHCRGAGNFDCPHCVDGRIP